jgi:hypothetical protein
MIEIYTIQKGISSKTRLLKPLNIVRSPLLKYPHNRDRGISKQSIRDRVLSKKVYCQPG